MSRLNIPSTHRGSDIYPENDGTETFEITVRFSASLPDLPLSIAVSDAPTTATLKQYIRVSLPDDLKNKRIRLIHAGKALDDATPLSTSLKRPVSRPPSRIPTPGPYDPGAETDTSTARSKLKGKAPIRDVPLPPQQRIYIHCSIGDVTLSESDLASEAALATTEAATPTEQSDEQKKSKDASATTTPNPRGFDRLLNAGFTVAEVQSLRLQFMSIQAHTHTPDTMPSPNTLRALEDHWLDNSNGAGGLANGIETDGPPGLSPGGDDDNRGALDDMIWGTTMGFLWPIGSLIWGTREIGIFSPRRKIAIVIGIALNLGLGFVRWGG